MMGFAMYTATGQLLSYTSSPSRHSSCLHIILKIQPTFPPDGGSKSSATMSQGGAGYLADVRFTAAFSFQNPLAVTAYPKHSGR